MDWSLLYKIIELRNPLLNTMLIFLSLIGDGGFIWVAITLVCLFIKKTRKVGVAMAISLLIMLVVGNLGLKNIIQRPRPCWIDQDVAMLIPVPKDYSFPSGHTYSSFSAATTIYLQKKNWGKIAFILAALIAFSRLYLFVHFPTDIGAGVFLGLGTGYLGTKLASYSKLENFYH